MSLNSVIFFACRQATLHRLLDILPTGLVYVCVCVCVYVCVCVCVCLCVCVVYILACT